MDSILQTIKEKLDIDPDSTDFDNELITDINSVLFILNEIGVGISGYTISGPDETWAGFLGSDRKDVEAVKTYTALKVRLMFDVDSMTSGIIGAIENQIKELEWRLYVLENTEVNNE